MKTLTSSKTSVPPWNGLSHCCSKCLTNSAGREGETTRSWGHDIEQKEPEVKLKMEQLSFNDQGCTAHARRSRDLWQMCLGNLHDLQKREGVSHSGQGERVYEWMFRGGTEKQNSYIFSYFLSSPVFQLIKSACQLQLCDQNKPRTCICLCQQL